MVKHICIHPPKVFIQSWISVTQLVKRKTRGYVNKEIAMQNIKVSKIPYEYTLQELMKYTHRWWCINRRIRPPTKI